MRTEHNAGQVNWSRRVARITLGAFVGAVAGLLAGLALLLLDATDNPFWTASVGLGVGAVASATWDLFATKP
ncbi:hypothetical protein [Cryptosporangium aurantiacum]|uniref:Uncharacterized protein n=1 Tax=Cryptosporangium aurantiacum TaxID=134849 RepID=A0A1M7R389_9ACTN|nr:hypothetical protein [Cryptosporangium aurantiacum]SHN39306.1 hypothetical protein SAMN05443668_106247 [Cryptosporangium aurantiacum]